MKNLVLKVACSILVFCFLPFARAVLPGADNPLPNFDKRNSTPQPLVVATPAARENARALLLSKLPEVKIATDKLLESPRWISSPRGFLTGPQGEGGAVSKAYLEAVPASDPHRIIKAFLNEHSALFGHDASALASANVTRDYVTKHNGLHTLVWEQTQDGIPVFEALFVGHLTRKGELVSLADHFVSNPAAAAAAGHSNPAALIAQPSVSVARAVANAALNIGATVDPGS